MNENVKTLPPMSFAEATKKGFSNLINFNGRARRSEYWWFVLIVAIISIVIGLIYHFTYGTMSIMEVIEHGGTLYALLTFIVSVISPLLLLSIQTRRIHDVGKSALLPMFSFVCSILFAICSCYYNMITYASVENAILRPEDASFNIALIFACVIVVLQLIILVYTLKDSQKMANRYGESPKYVEQ